MSQQSLFTDYTPSAPSSENSWTQALAAGEALAAQFRAESIPQVDPSIVALAQTRGLSSDQQQALNEDTRDFIYNPDRFTFKYGRNATAAINNQVKNYITSDDWTVDNRSLGSQARDIALGMGQGVAQMGLGLASLGASIVLPGTGASTAISRGANILTEWSNQLGSNYRQATQRANAMKQAARDALSEAQWKQDKANGDSDFYAGLKQIGRDALQGAKDWWNDPNQAEQTISNALGSLLMAGPISKGVSLAGQALGRTASSSLVKKLASNMAGTTEGRNLAAKMFGNEGLTNALLEMGGSVQGAVASVDALTYDQLMSNPTFVEKVQEYMSKGNTQEVAFQKAKDDLAGSVARYAALITAPIAAGAGVLASKVIRNPAGLDSWSPLSKVPVKLGQRGLEEAGEEGIQGFQQIGENLGMQAAGFDTHLWEGVGNEIAQGALAGGVSGASGPVLGAGTRIATAPITGIYNHTRMGKEAALGKTAQNFEDMRKAINASTTLTDEQKDAWNQRIDAFDNKVDLSDKTTIDTIEAASGQSLSDETKATFSKSKSLYSNIMDLADKARKLEKKHPAKAQEIYNDIEAIQSYVSQTKINTNDIQAEQTILKTVSEQTSKTKADTPEKTFRKNLLEALQKEDKAEQLSAVSNLMPTTELDNLENVDKTSPEYAEVKTAMQQNAAKQYISAYNSLSKTNPATGKSLLAEPEEALKTYASYASTVHNQQTAVKNVMGDISKRSDSLRKSSPEAQISYNNALLTKTGKRGTFNAKDRSSLEDLIQNGNSKVQEAAAKKLIDIYDNLADDAQKNQAELYKLQLSSQVKAKKAYAQNPALTGKKPESEKSFFGGAIPSFTSLIRQLGGEDKLPEYVQTVKNKHAAITQAIKEYASKGTSKVKYYDALHNTEATVEASNKNIEKLLREERHLFLTYATLMPDEMPIATDVANVTSKDFSKATFKDSYDTMAKDILDAIKPHQEENTESNASETQPEETSEEAEPEIKTEEKSSEKAAEQSNTEQQETQETKQEEKSEPENKETHQNLSAISDYYKSEHDQKVSSISMLFNKIRLYTMNPESMPKTFEEFAESLQDFDSSIKVSSYRVSLPEGDEAVSYTIKYKLHDSSSGSDIWVDITDELIKIFDKAGKGNSLLVEAQNTINSVEDISWQTAKDVEADINGDIVTFYHGSTPLMRINLSNPEELYLSYKNQDSDNIILERINNALPENADSEYKTMLLLSGIRHILNNFIAQSRSNNDDTSKAINALIGQYKGKLNTKNWYLALLPSFFVPAVEASSVEQKKVHPVYAAMLKVRNNEEQTAMTFTYENKLPAISIKHGEKQYYITLQKDNVFDGLYLLDTTGTFQQVFLSADEKKAFNDILPSFIQTITQETITDEVPSETDENAIEQVMKLFNISQKNTAEIPTMAVRRYAGDLVITGKTKNTLFRQDSGGIWYDERNSTNPQNVINDPEQIKSLNALAEKLLQVKAPTAINVNPKAYTKIIEHNDGVIELIGKDGRSLLERSPNGHWYVRDLNKGFLLPLSPKLNTTVQEFYDTNKESIPYERSGTTKSGAVVTKRLDLSTKSLTLSQTQYSLTLTDIHAGVRYELSSSYSLPGHTWKIITVNAKGEKKYRACNTEQSTSLSFELIRHLLNQDAYSLQLISGSMTTEEKASILANPISGIAFKLRNTPEGQRVTLYSKATNQIIGVAVLKSERDIKWDFSNHNIWGILGVSSEVRKQREQLFNNVLTSVLYSELHGQLRKHRRQLNTRNVLEENQVQPNVFVSNITPASLYQYLESIMPAKAGTEEYPLYNEIKLWMNLFSNDAGHLIDVLQNLLFENGVQILESKNIEQILYPALQDAFSIIKNERNKKEKITENLKALLNSKDQSNQISFASQVDLNNMDEASFFSLMQNTLLGRILEQVNQAAFNAIYDKFKQIVRDGNYQSKTYAVPEAMTKDLNQIAKDILASEEISKYYEVVSPIEPGKNLFTRMVSLAQSSMTAQATPELFNVFSRLFDLNSDSRNKNNLLNYFNNPVEDLYSLFSIDITKLSKEAFIEMFAIKGQTGGNIRAASLYDELSNNNFEVWNAFKKLFNIRSNQSLLGRLLRQLNSDFNQAINTERRNYLTKAFDSEAALLEALGHTDNANANALFMTLDSNGNLAWNQAFLAKAALAAISAYFKLAKMTAGTHDTEQHREVLFNYSDRDASIVRDVQNAAGTNVETEASVFATVRANIREYLDLQGKEINQSTYDAMLDSITATMLQSMANLGLFTTINVRYNEKTPGAHEVIVSRSTLSGSPSTSVPISENKSGAILDKTKVFIKVNSVTDQHHANDTKYVEDPELDLLAGTIQRNASYLMDNLILGLDQSGVHLSYASIKEYRKNQDENNREQTLEGSDTRLTPEYKRERDLREEQPSQANLPFFGLMRVLSQNDATMHSIAQFLGDDWNPDDYGTILTATFNSQKGKWISLTTAIRNLNEVFRRMRAINEGLPEDKKLTLSQQRLYNTYMINIMGRFSMTAGAQAQQDKCWRQMFPVALKPDHQGNSQTPHIDLNNADHFENLLRALSQGLGIRIPRIARGEMDYICKKLDEKITPSVANYKPLFETDEWINFCKAITESAFNNAIEDMDFSFSDPKVTKAVMDLINLLKQTYTEINEHGEEVEKNVYGIDHTWLALDNLLELARLYNKQNFKSFREFASFSGSYANGDWVANQVIENDGMNSGTSHIAHTLCPIVGNMTIHLLHVWEATGMGLAIPTATGSAAITLAQGSISNANDPNANEQVYKQANDLYQMVSNGLKRIVNQLMEHNILTIGGRWMAKDVEGHNFSTVIDGKNTVITPDFLVEKAARLISKLDANYHFNEKLTQLVVDRSASKFPVVWAQYGAGLETSAFNITHDMEMAYYDKISKYNKYVSQENYDHDKAHKMFTEIQEIAELMRQLSLVHVTGRSLDNMLSATNNHDASNISFFLPQVEEGQVIPDFVLGHHTFTVLQHNMQHLFVQGITDYMNNQLYGDSQVVTNKSAIVGASEAVSTMYEALQMAWINKLLEDAKKENGISSEQIRNIRKRIDAYLPKLKSKLSLNHDKAQLNRELITMRNVMLQTLINEGYFNFISKEAQDSLKSGGGLFSNSKDEKRTLLPSVHGNLDFRVRTGGGVSALIQAIQGLAEAGIISAMTEANPDLSFIDFYDGINFRLDGKTIEGTKLSNQYCYEIWTKLNTFTSFKDLLENFNKKLFFPETQEEKTDMKLAMSMFANCKTKIEPRFGKDTLVPDLEPYQAKLRDALYNLAISSGVIVKNLSKEVFTKQLFTFVDDKGNRVFTDDYQEGLFQEVMLNGQAFLAQKAREQDIQNRAIRGIYPMIVDQLTGLGIGFESEVEPLPKNILDEKELDTLKAYLFTGQFEAANNEYVKIYNKVTAKLATLPEYSIEKYFAQEHNGELFAALVKDYRGKNVIFQQAVRAALAPVADAENMNMQQEMEQVLHAKGRTSKKTIRKLYQTVNKLAAEINEIEPAYARGLKSLHKFLQALINIPSIQNSCRIIEISKSAFHGMTDEERNAEIKARIDRRFPKLAETSPASYKDMLTTMQEIYGDAEKLAEQGGKYFSFNGGKVIYIFVDSNAELTGSNESRAKALRQRHLTLIHELIHAFTADFMDNALVFDNNQKRLIVNQNAFNGDMLAYKLVSHFTDIFTDIMQDLLTQQQNSPEAFSKLPGIIQTFAEKYSKAMVSGSMAKVFHECLAYGLTEEHMMKMLSQKMVNVEDLGVVKTARELWEAKDSETANSSWWLKFKQNIKAFIKDINKFIEHMLRKAIGKSAQEILQEPENRNVLNDMFWSLQELFTTDAYQEYYSNIEQNSQNMHLNSFVETARSSENLNAQTVQQGLVPSKELNQRAKKSLIQSSILLAQKSAEKALLPSTTNNLVQRNQTVLHTVAQVFDLSNDQVADYNNELKAIMQTFYLDRSQLKPLSEAMFKAMEAMKEDDVFVTSSNPTEEELEKSAQKVKLLRVLQQLPINLPDVDTSIQISYALPVFLALCKTAPDMQRFLSSIPWNTPKEHEPVHNLNGFLKRTGFEFHKWLHNKENEVKDKNASVWNIYQQHNTIIDGIFACNQKSVFDKMPSTINSLINSFEQFVSEQAVEAAMAALNRAYKYGPHSLIGAANVLYGNALQLINPEPVAEIPKEMFRNFVNNNEVLPRFFKDIANDILGFARGSLSFYVLRKKMKARVERLRQHYRTNLPKEIRKLFNNKLSKHQWESLYRSLARTGIGTLVYLQPELLDKIPALLQPQNAIIADAEQQLDKLVSQKSKKFILSKAKQAAHYMITGEAGSYLLKNAYAILKTAMVENAVEEDDINKLISLYALAELSDKDKNTLLNLYDTYEEEIKRVVKYMAYLHKEELAKIAGLEQAIKDNPNDLTALTAYNRVKMNALQNFIPVTRTEGTSMIVAKDADRTRLEKYGYQRMGDYNNELAKGYGYYYSPHPQEADFMEGLIVITSPSYQGCYQNTGRVVQGVSHSDMITGKDAQVITKALKEGTLDSATSDNLIPVFGGLNGTDIIGYEFGMNPTQASFIENKTELPEMLGILQGRQVEEKVADSINTATANLVVENFDPTGLIKNQYIDILDSKHLNAVQRDAVSKIPYSVIQTMKEQFAARGFNNHIYIRRDLFIDIIGERKMSIIEAFKPETSDLNPTVLKATEKILTGIFGNYAMKVAVNGEQAIHGVVSWAKTTIVVRSVVVSIANMAANIFYLLACGVPLKTLLKEIPALLDDCETYVKNQKKIRRLELLENSSKTEKEANYYRSQRLALEDANKMLEISDIMDEFSLINDLGRSSEDIALSKGRIGEWIQDQINKLPDSVVSSGKFLLMARDTPIFEALEKSVQYGDFISKAILYRHRIATQKMSPGEARARILDEFVDYDKNSGRMRNYLESSGLLWFCNFPIRIMRVATRLLREHPARAILMLAVANPFGDIFRDSLLGKIFLKHGFSTVGIQMFFQAFKLMPLVWLL